MIQLNKFTHSSPLLSVGERGRIMTIKVRFIGRDGALIKQDNIIDVDENNLEEKISSLDNVIYGFGGKLEIGKRIIVYADCDHIGTIKEESYIGEEVRKMHKKLREKFSVKSTSKRINGGNKMRFEISVKKKIGNPSDQRTLFDLDDTKDIESKLIGMKRDIVGDLKQSYVADIKECITVSCNIAPAFSIDLDLDKNTVEDNERILDHVMKEIINRINIKKNGPYNYAPLYIGNPIMPNNAIFSCPLPFPQNPNLVDRLCTEFLFGEPANNDNSDKDMSKKAHESNDRECIENLQSAIDQFVAAAKEFIAVYENKKKSNLEVDDE